MNTSAFSGPSTGPAALPDCNPFFRLNEKNLKCRNRNGILVLDSGYETSGNIPNSTCDLLIRTGTLQDREFGCYADSSWGSELPGAYVDTTFEDGAESYNAGIGSAAAHLIQPGIEYVSIVNFDTIYLSSPLNLTGQPLGFEGQIGAPDETFTSCFIGMTWCIFAIDITPIDSVIFP